MSVDNQPSALKLLPAEDSFRQEVKRLRVARGLSQAQLVRELNDQGVARFNQSVLSRIEAGSRQVQMIEAEAFARYFDRDVGAMMDPKGVRDDLYAVEEALEQARATQIALFDTARHRWRALRNARDSLDLLDTVEARFGANGHMAPFIKELRERLQEHAKSDIVSEVQAIVAGYEQVNADG